MDVKTDLTAIPVRELLTKFSEIQWLPKGRDRFSVKPLMRSPLVLAGFALLSTASSIANPLGVDPYPFWHDLILGPKVQQVQIFEPPTDQIEISSDTQTVSSNPEQNESISIEDILFKNFSPKDKALMEEKIDQQLKEYKQSDPERAKRVLENWKTTVDAILALDVPVGDRQYWHKLILALLYLESGGNSVKNIEKPTETSTAGAEGPAQMTRATAQAVAKQHGLFNINPENGWTSIRLARFHLADLIKKYGDLGIALTAYYGGEGLVNIKNSQDGEEYFIKIGAGMKNLEEVDR